MIVGGLVVGAIIGGIFGAVIGGTIGFFIGIILGGFVGLVIGAGIEDYNDNLERDEMRLKAEKKAVQIAVTLAKYNSGLVTLETTQIIKDWISNRVSVRDEKDDKRKVRDELKQTLNLSISSPIAISSIIIFSSDAKDFETIGKYNIMKFLLRVVASFNHVKTSDIKKLDVIAKDLQLENDEYQAAKHKYLPVDTLDDADPFVVLGIPSSLTKSEKKAKILELFQKWNALATHKEPAMREKAEKMIDCIAKCRERLR